MRKTLLLLTGLTLFFASCGKDDVRPEPTPDGNVVLNCVKPACLSAGDTVALISPAYYTPMENVEATANLLRSWGLVPVIGPNVGKIVDGRYAGTVDERVSDILWAFNEPGIKAIICNRGGYGTIQLIDHIPLFCTGRFTQMACRIQRYQHLARPAEPRRSDEHPWHHEFFSGTWRNRRDQHYDA